MDVTPYQELKMAPRHVFDALDERRARPRFMVPTADGDWQAVTWGRFAEQIRCVASYLAHIGFAPGDHAAIFADNSVAWLSAALGIQAAGGVMVPIYPASTPEQARYILAHAGVKVLFCSQPAPADLPACVARAVALDDGPSWHELCEIGSAHDRSHPGAFEARMHEVPLDRPGLMLYTSGTTGPPKGVPLTHRNVAVNGRDWLSCFASVLDHGMVDLLWLPMSHIFGFGQACLGNTLGFVSYLSDPGHVVDHLVETRPDVFMSVPAYWEKIARPALAIHDREERRRVLRAATGGRLRFCLSGGAGLDRAIKEAYHAAGMLIIEGYGLTECSPTLTLNRPDAFRFDAVGKPLPSVALVLADDGEILARGDSVFSGYHRDEAATRAAFDADGWFKTGDLGAITEDGFLRITGRKKEILVTAGGKNVPPANIEQRFAGDPMFCHVVVYGDGKKYLTAGIWLNPAISPSHDQVAAAVARVNASLARHERIQRFRIMDTPLSVERGLLTSTLKVRRQEVYDAFRADFEALYDA